MSRNHLKKGLKNRKFAKKMIRCLVGAVIELMEGYNVISDERIRFIYFQFTELKVCVERRKKVAKVVGGLKKVSCKKRNHFFLKFRKGVGIVSCAVCTNVTRLSNNSTHPHPPEGKRKIVETC